MKPVLIKILFLFAVIFSHAYGQGNYLIKEYNITDGLVQSTVNTSYLDNFGFLWFGTDNGLSRFDGINFKNYTQPAYLFSKPIMSISQNPENHLLLLTDDGELWVFDGIDFFKDYKLLPEENTIVSSISLIKNMLYISTQEKGLYVINNDTTIVYTTDEGLFSNTVLRVTTDRLSNINIITEEGVNQLINDKLVKLFDNREIKISQIIQHSSGNYWCTVDGQGVFRRENNKWVRQAYIHSAPFHSLIEDSSSVIWSACDILLHRFVENMYGKVYSFNDIQMGVSSLTIDPSNNIWCGTFGNGVKKIRENPFFNVLPMKDFPGFFTLILFEDSQDNVWISSYKTGLVKFNKKLDYYTTENGLPDNLVLSVCEYEDEILVATNKGIVVYENDTFKKFDKPKAPIPGRPSRMFVDSRNNLWTATRTNGLYKLENNEWKEFPLDYPSGVKSVRVILKTATITCGSAHTPTDYIF